ncbi:nucleotide sugar dehydrogenase [Bacillus timonensis]|uniref:nucleotide sugar dehydrogenase n=1 Tax=Bacillus timonensis TaxID=1033734 RepID=UPI0002890A17|nr:nucleotide sugar dehydrogenase [Bacillus timonensis]
METEYNNGKQQIGVIGLGFVGLPLALLFVRNGFNVIGIDLDKRKIDSILNSRSYIEDISNEEIEVALSSGRFHASQNYDEISKLDTIIICVPTPLTNHGTPDLGYVQNVALDLYPRLKTGQLVVLESSTFPGTTREVLQPILEKSKMKIGKDLFLGYSPERIDPGNKQFKVEEVPKVVSGITENCRKQIETLYKHVFLNVVSVTSTEVAELCKLLENSYRYINISFINEMAILCDSLDIDLWEVIDASSTKPYGFSPFYPGPGVGGHCIPVDPIYLYWKAKQAGFESRYLNLAATINDEIMDYIVYRIQNSLSNLKGLTGKKIIIYGMAYKKDISDYRESPSLYIMEKLAKLGAEVEYHDPFIPTLEILDQKYSSIELTEEALRSSDCFVIITDHTSIPLDFIVTHAPLIYDTRNVTKNYSHYKNIIRLGCGN